MKTILGLRKHLSTPLTYSAELDTLQLKGSPLFSIDELEQIKQVTSVVAKRLTDIEVHENAKRCNAYSPAKLKNHIRIR